jgi:hypothetical protein
MIASPPIRIADAKEPSRETLCDEDRKPHPVLEAVPSGDHKSRVGKIERCA